MQFWRYLTVLTMVALVGWFTSHADQSKTYDLSGFTGVHASAAVDVEITQGDAFSVSAYTESGDFSGLELQVEDGVLIATRPEEIWKGKNSSTWQRFFGIEPNNKNISIKRVNGQRVIKINGERVPTYTVRVTAPSIDRLDASSSSIVTAKEIKTSDLAIKASSSGDINAEVAGGDVSVDATSSGDVILSGTYDNLDIKATSSSDVILSGTYDNLDIKATSSSDVILSGTCDKLDIKATSSADVKASDLTSQQLNLRSTSSSNIRAKVSGGDVSVDATSSGDVVLSGNCDNLDVKATSSADVKASDLTCQNGNLRASSGGDIIAMLTKTVNAHASSGGDILVRGGAKPVKVKESSGGDVSIRN